MWYVQGVRGLWFGFYRGFFHDLKKPQSTCLSSTMEKDVADVMKWMAYGEFADIFKVADSLTNLYYDNRLGCGYSDIMQTINNQCLKTEEGSDKSVCSFGNIFTNLFTSHMIETMG